MTLPHGEMWLMRPVLRGLCKYESLKDGAFDLCDIAILNDTLDVQDENERRWHKAQAKK